MVLNLSIACLNLNLHLHFVCFLDDDSDDDLNSRDGDDVEKEAGVINWTDESTTVFYSFLSIYEKSFLSDFITFYYLFFLRSISRFNFF